MDKTNNLEFPKILYVIIVAILAAMYYYAAYVDTTPAEKTVQNFYQAYFDRDYDTVADNLSVFWAVQFLPQYQSLAPNEMIAQRDTIIKDLTSFISEMESKNKVPEGLTVEIDRDFTKQGTNSSLVAYSFKENGKDAGMEMAILINEAGTFRIFSFTPTTPEYLSQIGDKEMQELDKQLGQITGQK